MMNAICSLLRESLSAFPTPAGKTYIHHISVASNTFLTFEHFHTSIFECEAKLLHNLTHPSELILLNCSVKIIVFVQPQIPECKSPLNTQHSICTTLKILSFLSVLHNFLGTSAITYTPSSAVTTKYYFKVTPETIKIGLTTCNWKWLR